MPVREKAAGGTIAKGGPQSPEEAMAAIEERRRKDRERKASKRKAKKPGLG
jgi:hypothetical protein